MANAPQLPGQHGELVTPERRITTQWMDWARWVTGVAKDASTTATAASEAAAAIPGSDPTVIHPSGTINVYGDTDTGYTLEVNPGALNITTLMGPPGRDGEPGEDSFVPGPPGPQGPIGPTGPAGSGGGGSSVVVYEDHYAEEPAHRVITAQDLLDAAAGGVQGDVLYRAAAGWARLAAGTSGHFLKTLGAGANPAWAAASAGAGGLAQVATATVAGSAATVLSISGADLNTDLFYIGVARLKNATGSSSFISVYFNADTTAGNYDREVFSFSGTTVGGGRGNDGIVAEMPASSFCTIYFFLSPGQDGKGVLNALAVEGRTTGIVLRASAHAYRTAVNITGITLSAGVASSIDISSNFRVLK